MEKKNKINPDLAEQFQELNISPKSFQAGGIYQTNDQKILFPTRNSDKVKDKPRLVVLFGAEEHLNDPMIPTVLAAPITTVMDETPQCLPVSAGTGNLNYNSMIKAGLIQPVLKTDLGPCIGTLDPTTHNQLKATVFTNLGLGEGLEEDEEEDIVDSELTSWGGNCNDSKD